MSLTGILTPPTTSSNNQITVTTEEASTGNLVDQSTCSVVAVSTQSLSLSTISAFTVGV